MVSREFLQITSQGCIGKMQSKGSLSCKVRAVSLRMLVLDYMEPPFLEFAKLVNWG